jgi:predicted aldo/keto reductase-like oxidoreductase
MTAIATRPLGKTSERVSILGLGGGHIARSQVESAEAVRIMQYALDEGVTFFDNAWEYHDGRAELLMGEALRGRREKAFLMTKVCARDRVGAEKQLEESLKRLQTDYLDLWQFHEINYANDHEWIFAPGGAAEAGLQALKAGKVRYLGFTGHKDPEYMLSMLAYDYPWSTAQLPINILDANYRSFLLQIVPELQKRDIAIIGMKSLGGNGQFVTDAGLSAAECMRFALSQPIATLVSGIDSMAIAEQNIDVARAFEPMSTEEQGRFIEATRAIAGDGRHEWSKTTNHFDSKVHRDQHGFPTAILDV